MRMFPLRMPPLPPPPPTRRRRTKSFHRSKLETFVRSELCAARTAPLHRSIPATTSRTSLRRSKRRRRTPRLLANPRSTPRCCMSSAHAVKVLWRRLRRRMSRRMKSFGRSRHRREGAAFQRQRKAVRTRLLFFGYGVESARECGRATLFQRIASETKATAGQRLLEQDAGVHCWAILA